MADTNEGGYDVEGVSQNETTALFDRLFMALCSVGESHHNQQSVTEDHMPLTPAAYLCSLSLSLPRPSVCNLTLRACG